MTDTPTTTRIPLADAEIGILRDFAGITLGLEIKPSMNRGQIIGLIQSAAPTVAELPAPAAPPAPVERNPAVLAQIPPAPSAPVIQHGSAMPHPGTDPKVKVKILPTADKSRAKDVTLAVNGDVIRMQRNVAVEIPYRFFIGSLVDAKEKQAVETGEVNGAGIPIRSYEEVQSYDYQVLHMPSDEEIADWHARTDNAVSSPHANAKAA